MRDVPEEIPDADSEQVLARVCAIDVAKEFGTVCTRLPSPAGRRSSRVWQVAATTNAVTDLAAQLVAAEVQKVTVESTSDYWRIWFYLLEAAGLDVQLVNARDVKNVPGRPKTDKLDAVWLAKLTEKGLLRPSFVPPASIRALRDYTRMRVDLIRDRTRNLQRMEKLLEDALIKVTTVASSLRTLSTRDMIEALIRGEHDPNTLAELARGRMRGKRTALIEALTGRFKEHHGELARILLDQIDRLDTQIAHLSDRIAAVLAEIDPPRPSGDAIPTQDEITVSTAWQRLCEIPGISTESAQMIIAEIGLDMSRFATPAHLVSWARLCPRTIQSGTSLSAGKAGKGNPYLKGTLGMAAAAAARGGDTFLAQRYRRLVKRRGKSKALVAIARSMLVIVWHLLASPDARFHDLGADFHERRVDTTRKTASLVRQLEALGLTVTLQPTA
ncbi:IS110 family RNA-guided transposase [Micromonospora craniellae]|uniref:IS110 family transposase n=1 Tax=Micromonospora craniellae TaxID=2294034 RepID=A0A372FSA0_9ACTN|nr:IS110 family transposase [Micromonospora craniellae]QOC90854.1 IS110 family transposase [Micromonospora craniellae]QOC90855.1 IS110 family transposase [Micromonospora craniellae]RFS43494.1 IS110 family transposase [Micromonospora craniellae]RFS43495.1 IS110 family transposase [Micromonospora craniellae]